MGLPPRPPKGAHFKLEMGDKSLDVKCDEDEPMRACADIGARERDGRTEHHLTPAGFRAVGLKPPRSGHAHGKAGLEEVSASGSAEAPTSGTKRDLVLGLLGRGEGASLGEVIAATGWLAHTSRAALSRLRSGGQAIVKNTREDGSTAYRIVADEPKPRGRAARTRPANQAVEG